MYGQDILCGIEPLKSPIITYSVGVKAISSGPLFTLF